MSASLDLSNRRKPAFRLPPGATDAHCHVFGPGDRFPYAPTRSYTPEDAPKEMLAALHRHLGVGRVAIVQASCHGTDNAAMLDAIADSPNTIRGVAVIDDTFSERDLTRLHEGGVRGFRFNFVRHLGGAPDLDVFHRVVNRVAAMDMGWHLVLHLDAPDIVPLSDMIKALPLTFAIDHMGRVDSSKGVDQPPVQALVELIKRDNAWIKVCGSERISKYPFDAAVPIARLLVETSRTRVMWGTDFPHPNLADHVDEADLVDLVPKIAPTPELQQALLVDNPARLYGFD
jgi:predicted TIM-barrel fold metal-dependent hydrolase